MADAFEKEFEDLWKSLGKRAFCFKITDTRELSRFKATTKKQPSDYIVIVNGCTFFGEVKKSEDKTSFPFSNIQPGQLGYSQRILAAGGEYYFFVKSTVTGKWYRVPAKLVHDTLKAGRKSLKWTELEPYSFKE